MNGEPNLLIQNIVKIINLMFEFVKDLNSTSVISYYFFSTKVYCLRINLNDFAWNSSGRHLLCSIRKREDFQIRRNLHDLAAIDEEQ